MKQFRVSLKLLYVGQFHLSTEKLRGALDGFDPADLTPFAVRKLDGRLTLTDGHHTAFVAMLWGIEAVEVSYDTDDCDWERWEASTRESWRRGVHHLSDLVGRLVTKDEYKELWCGFYDEVYEEFRLRRSGRGSPQSPDRERE